MYAALLGTEPVMDDAYYVQFDTADEEVGLDPHGLGLDPHGHSTGMTGPVGFWHVEDIEASVAHLLAAGASEQQPVKDLGGRLIATRHRRRR